MAILVLSVVLALLGLAADAWSQLMWHGIERREWLRQTPDVSAERWQQFALFMALLASLVSLPTLWIGRAYLGAAGSLRSCSLCTVAAWSAQLQWSSGGSTHGLPWILCVLEAMPIGLLLALAVHRIWPAEPVRVSPWAGTAVALAIWVCLVHDHLGSGRLWALENLLLTPLFLSPLWLPPLLARRWPRVAKACGAAVLGLAAWLMLRETEAPSLEWLFVHQPLILIGLAHLSGWSWGDSSSMRRPISRPT